MQSEIDVLIDGYLNEMYEEFPEAASSLGIKGHDDRLGDYSQDAFARRNSQTDQWEERFLKLDASQMSLDESLDRDLIVSSLKGSQVMRDWEGFRRDPLTYLNPGLSGIFTLFLHRLHPESELAASAASRLKAVPAVIEDGKKNIDASSASKLSVQRAMGQCKAGITYFRTLVPAEVTDDHDKQLLAEAGEVAAAAYEDFARFLSELAEKAEGGWAIGDKRYSGLLIEKERLGYDASEMLSKGKAEYERLSVEMAEFSQEHFGDADWARVLKNLHKDHPTSPEDMQSEYAHWTEMARQYLKDHDLVTFPEGEVCHVVPSPHFQRPILAVASYGRPPAFGDTKTGYFFVPYPPEGTSDEEVQKRLESNSRVEIPTTSVHEAYPGHHWHLVKIQDNPRKIRKVITTPYFTEGWALYAEKMMREQGFYAEPSHELAHLEARIFRAARFIVDTSLHLELMPFEEAIRFMIDKACLSEPTARAEVGRYCSWPTQAPSYLTGALEVDKMRDEFFAKGLGDLKAFHDKIATSGGLPIGLARKALLEG